MSTYSIGQYPTDADKLEDLVSVLSGLPDNTQKLITPKNVRNAIFTTWENITFKLTKNNGGTSYIGIDRSDITSKILIGKKEKTTEQPVLSPNLLASDVDVFFFNTKSSTQAADTKVAFLAGTGSYFTQSQLIVPYIESAVVGNDLNFNIVNPSGTGSTGGSINIESNNFITLNGLIMPTKVQNNNPANDGYVLKYSWIGGNAYGIWGTVASSGQTISSETFTDTTPVTAPIGGIQVGETFNNVPVTTMLRKLIYQYIKPTIAISLTTPIIEIGDLTSAGSLRVNWVITRTATQSLTSVIFQPAITPSITAGLIPQGSTSGSSSLSQTAQPQADVWRIVNFTSSVTDGVGSSTASTSLLFTLPWYYGTSGTSTTQSTGINSILGTNSFSGNRLIPLLTNPATQSSIIHNKSLSLTTFGLNNNQGYVYFGYPSNFVDLVDIKDNNGYSIFTSFRKFTITGISSPPRWSGRTYSFWILTGSTTSVVPQLTTIDPSSPFQFIFATQS